MEILNIYPEEQLLIKYCAKKHLILLEIQNMMDIKEAIKNFLIKKISGGTVENEIVSNKELAEGLNKPIIRKVKKRNAHSYFTDNSFLGGRFSTYAIDK